MVLDWNEYANAARKTAAEGCVLLKNEEAMLPLKKGSRVAVFGRIQRHYYKSGTGSGGMVNVSKTVGILDALLENPDVVVDKELLEVYDRWEETHPFDEGEGWASEPWSQIEMPVNETLVRDCAGRNDAAVIIIGRTAGEDKDNADEPGAYRLSDCEADMIGRVCSAFQHTAVIFNVGSVMDMGHPCLAGCHALLYGWQGGMFGGYGVVDVLTGRENPSGRLADTLAAGIHDYPSTRNFGDGIRNFYQEDIYVGYRYFETVAKDKVLYPFGFGLSYTQFRETVTGFEERDGDLTLSVEVENVGHAAGKQVVQVYVEAPSGCLGTPSRVLVGFAKTGCLEPGHREQLEISVSKYGYASYDDSGVTGYPYCYVLEPGEYHVYMGTNVRDAVFAAAFSVRELRMVRKLTRNLAPVSGFDRMKPHMRDVGNEGDGENEAARGETWEMIYEPVPTAGEEEEKKRTGLLPEEISYTGDRGYRLCDVAAGTVTMEQFIAQLSDEDMSCMIRGEGMGSPKVTPGTAAAYGGVSKHLAELGIPCACCSDGPSGIRMDSGKKAFSLPNGTLMACTFNLPLIETLYSYTGMEMAANGVDNLLGPGMNIHRNPLNGRNFEYFSEDPLLTGKMAAAMLRGLKRSGVTGTIKHFAANNQETNRNDSDSVVSERALREIYLKGFEIAVREGGADSVMTTYGSLNGVWTAGRFELNTCILRGEWGFSGIVMTDWWAKISCQGHSGKAVRNDLASMARAQNDVYMVCQKSDQNLSGDNTLTELESGGLTRGELQRNAMNICRQIMSLPAFRRSIGEQPEVEIINRPPEDDIEAPEREKAELQDEM